MASSSEKSVKLPEKSSFSQTCSLLSQYLKERGSFGDLNLGMSCKNIEANEVPRRPAATTMNLFPMIDNSGNVSAAPNMTAPRNCESMNWFPQQAGFTSKNDAPNMVDSSSIKPGAAALETQKAQMTIFYGGQVIVFNDFAADKANEIMQLASKGCSTLPSMPVQKSPIESSPLTPSLPTNPTPTGANNLIPEHTKQPPSRPVTCDFPIARRHSLHRFLEKRKDRIVARAPYQVSSLAGAVAPNKPAESNSWLGLAAQTSQ